MTNKLEISRELLTVLADLNCPYDQLMAAKHMAAEILAAPVVERHSEEPLGAVDATLLSDCVEFWVRDYGQGHFATLDCVTQVYTSPPAPVAVVLPERIAIKFADDPIAQAEIDGWNACLDKVKELNR